MIEGAVHLDLELDLELGSLEKSAYILATFACAPPEEKNDRHVFWGWSFHTSGFQPGFRQHSSGVPPEVI